MELLQNLRQLVIDLLSQLSYSVSDLKEDTSIPSPDSAIKAKFVSDAVNNLLKKHLSEQDLLIIELCFGLNGREETHRDFIAERCGKNRVWVDGRIDKLLKQLKKLISIEAKNNLLN